MHTCSSNYSKKRSSPRKLVNELGQLLCSLEGNRVVVAGPDTTDAAMPLEARQILARGLLEEGLLGFVDIAVLSNVSIIAILIGNVFSGCTLVTRKQMFILERAALSGTMRYTSGCASRAA